jgi:hypothetical protein
LPLLPAQNEAAANQPNVAVAVQSLEAALSRLNASLDATASGLAQVTTATATNDALINRDVSTLSATLGKVPRFTLMYFQRASGNLSFMDANSKPLGSVAGPAISGQLGSLTRRDGLLLTEKSYTIPDNVKVQTRAGTNRSGFFFTPASATSQAQFTFSIEVRGGRGAVAALALCSE